jgi:hypothetical protein
MPCNGDPQVRKSELQQSRTNSTGIMWRIESNEYVPIRQRDHTYAFRYTFRNPIPHSKQPTDSYQHSRWLDLQRLLD